MVIFYEIMKILFLLLTILIAIFFLRGNYILPDVTFVFWQKVLLPFYLVLAGVMLGYIISQIMVARGEEEGSLSRTYVRGFTIGLVIGLTGAFLYIFFEQS